MRGDWLKAERALSRWTSEAGWLRATSYEVMKMKAVNHKPVIRLSQPSPSGEGAQSL